MVLGGGTVIWGKEKRVSYRSINKQQLKKKSSVCSVTPWMTHSPGDS